MERKFKIGDVVAHVAADRAQTEKGTSSDTKRKVKVSWMRARIVRYIVMEFINQTCHGGTQYFYRCRLVAADGAVGAPFVDLAEFELVEFQPMLEEVEVML